MSSNKSWFSALFGSSSREPEPAPSASSTPAAHNSPEGPDSRSFQRGAQNRGSPAITTTDQPPLRSSLKQLGSFTPSARIISNGASSTQRTPGRGLFVDTNGDTSESITRKRQLVTSPENSLLTSDRIKRFRENLAKSRPEDKAKLSVFSSLEPKLPRLDNSTFTAPSARQNLSAMDSPGGSSNFSHLSRRSAAPSLQSNVSSKTRNILEQLERCSTPQSNTQRVPAFRTSSGVTEVWNTSWQSGNGSMTRSQIQATGTPPPLRRQTIEVPSRMQVLTSSLSSHYKKPYWRDLSRSNTAPSPSGSAAAAASPALQRVRDGAGVKISPLFDLTAHQPAVTPKETVTTATTATPPLKGPDGKKGRNTFSMQDIEESGDDDIQTLTEANGLPITAFAPPKGFLDNCLFSFAAPVERGPQVQATDESDDDSEEKQSSGTDETDTEENQPPAVPQKKLPVFGAPTDSETSGAGTPSSSKNTSPESLNKTPTVATNTATTTTAPKWECPTCMMRWEESTRKCACGYDKDGKSTSTESTTFKPTSFTAPPSTTTVSFGFGSKTAKPAEVAKPAATTAKPTTCPDCWSSIPAEAKSCLSCGHVVGAAPAPPPPAPSTATTTSSATTERKDWSCPTCFVGNKADQSKCPCCDHEMYKETAGGEQDKPKSVFGANAFNPTAAANAGGFKFGTSAAAASTNGGPSFGIKPAEEKKDEPPKFGVTFGAKPDADKPASTPTFGMPKTTTTTESPKPAAASGTSIFGAAASAMKPFTFGASPNAKDAASASSTPAAPASGLVFGATKPMFGQTPATTSATPSTDAPAKTPLFGQIDGATKPLFGSSLAAPTTDKPAAAATPFGQLGGDRPLFGMTTPAFGSSSTAPAAAAPTTAAPNFPVFGASATTAAATPALKFGEPSAKISFGPSTTTTKADSTTEAAKPLFAFGSTSAPSVFGSSTGSMFGNGSSSTSQADAPETKRKMFEPSAPVAAAAAPSTGFSFGPLGGGAPAPATNGFNFGAAPAQPFGSSASAPVFGAPSSSIQSTPSFAAPTAAPTSFNFTMGAPAAAPTNGAPAPFVFGSSAAPAQNNLNGGFSMGAPMPSFNAPQQPSLDSPFAFSSTTSSGPQRKLAAARRRLTGKK
ncbi:unnamed protein product, partial [Mesorhabditis spiculigera]